MQATDRRIRARLGPTVRLDDPASSRCEKYPPTTPIIPRRLAPERRLDGAREAPDNRGLRLDANPSTSGEVVRSGRYIMTRPNDVRRGHRDRTYRHVVRVLLECLSREGSLASDLSSVGRRVPAQESPASGFATTVGLLELSGSRSAGGDVEVVAGERHRRGGRCCRQPRVAVTKAVAIVTNLLLGARHEGSCEVRPLCMLTKGAKVGHPAGRPDSS